MSTLAVDRTTIALVRCEHCKKAADMAVPKGTAYSLKCRGCKRYSEGVA